MKSLLLAVILTFPLYAFAGFTKGNGGNILKCNGSQNIVLDTFEMSELHSFEYEEQLRGSLDFFNIIEKRLAKINPEAAKNFKTLVADLANNVTFIAASDLGEIYDVFAVIIPVNCELVQAASQRNNRILVSQSLFRSLSYDEQNILLLHEVLYTLLLNKKTLDDSRPVRALVSLLISKNFLNKTSIQVENFFKEHVIVL